MGAAYEVQRDNLEVGTKDFRERVGKNSTLGQVDRLESEMNKRFDKVDKRFDKVDSKFNALIITLISGLFGIIGTLITLVIKL